jgi:hypothetical protein
MCALQRRAGPGVKEAIAVPAAKVDVPPLAVFFVNVDVASFATVGTARTFGVNELHELLKTAKLGASFDSSRALHEAFPSFPLALVPSRQEVKAGQCARTFLY